MSKRYTSKPIFYDYDNAIDLIKLIIKSNGGQHGRISRKQVIKAMCGDHTINTCEFANKHRIDNAIYKLISKLTAQGIEVTRQVGKDNAIFYDVEIKETEKEKSDNIANDVKAINSNREPRNSSTPAEAVTTPFIQDDNLMNLDMNDYNDNIDKIMEEINKRKHQVIQVCNSLTMIMEYERQQNELTLNMYKEQLNKLKDILK